MSLHSDNERRRQTEEKEQLIDEWMIAAAVIDRVCLIVFSIIFVAGTVGIFLLGVVKK